MTVVLDTTVLIDILRGRRAALEAVQRRLTSGERVVASVLSRSEVLVGERPGEEGATEALFGAVEWHPVDEATADQAGRLARRFYASHRTIDLADYVVAATAQMLMAELWTSNVKHFPMFAGLKAPYDIG